MITIHKNTVQNSKLKRIKNFDTRSWICVTNPSLDELAQLSKRIGVSKDLLHDTIDRGELPRFEVENNKVIIILRTPKFLDNESVDVMPITVILSDTYITTITIESSSVIDDMKNGTVPIVTTQQSNFLIKLFLRVIQQYQRHISTINRTVQTKKAQLNQVQKADVIRLMETEELLNTFITSLTPTISTIKKIVNQKYITLYQQDQDLIEDLLIDAEQVLEFCITNLKTVRNVRDSYTTVMTLRLNKIVEVLTYITAFLTIPMLIASIYGMNIRLPIAESEHAFIVLAIITILAIFTFVWYFARLQKRG